MKAQVIYVLTHDSIGVGEDGPTHQPIEHVSSLRVIPNTSTWRPCDQVEAAVAWKHALLNKTGPTGLILTRQNLKQQARDPQQVKNIEKGGYVLVDSATTPEYIILATGSEVEIAVDAAAILTEQGKAVRVVSMPSFDTFDAQDSAYKEQVLPAAVSKRIAIEAGSTGLWYKYVGLNGDVLGLDHFGESAPAPLLFKEFGLTKENLVARTLAL